MASEDDYEYSTDENNGDDDDDGDDDDNDEYSVENDGDVEDMDWNEVDNPNAPPTASSSSFKGKIALLDDGAAANVCVVRIVTGFFSPAQSGIMNVWRSVDVEMERRSLLDFMDYLE